MQDEPTTPEPSGEPVIPSAPENQAWPPAEPALEVAPAPVPLPLAETAWAPPQEPPPADAKEPRQSPSTGAVIGISLFTALIVASVVGGAAGLGGAWLATHSDQKTPSTVQVIPAETDEPVIAAAAAALPTVVNIDVAGVTATAASPDSGLPGGHPGVPAVSNGSGVAYKRTEDGGTYIITNAHVVENGEDISVTDSGREYYDGELVGFDTETDIAVVSVSAKLPLIDIGNSHELSVGQLVVAIGSPYGLSQSVSSGVVSALGRALTDSVDAPAGIYPLIDVIQTDAAINPGNSGGALVDRAGRLVGVNSAIYSDTGASAGIGFAIPVETAVRVADQLILSGTVDHPFLGVLGQDVDSVLAKEEKLPVAEGAFVVDVTKGTEAEKAGVKKGDVIVSLDSAKIRSMNDLILEVRRHEVGDRVVIGLYRKGERAELTMTVGTKPANIETPAEEAE
ncbi:MAG: trypsin-like peptidase domain-containing protein [Actinomycetota bacterium]|nr:trypsin-like peptidase domain-containing protein [Actinomycetota bacterium]